jgi:hypothetical protein
MRFIALLVVVAIIYVVMARHATQSSSEVKEAIATVDANLPAKQPGAVPAPSQGGAPAQSDYRRVIDRAHAVVDEVHRQQSGQ